MITAIEIHRWIESAKANPYREQWVSMDEQGKVIKAEPAQKLVEESKGAHWLVFVPEFGTGLVVPATSLA